MFYKNFLSLQVKGWAIITSEHGMYELVNDLRVTILRTEKISENSVNFIE